MLMLTPLDESFEICSDERDALLPSVLPKDSEVPLVAN
jgi:hypothetical protein